MHVAQLWRYPVKSVGGERLTSAEVGQHGLVGDRSHGIVDLATGMVLTGRRAPRLLQASASWTPAGVTITLDDGTVLADDAALSDWLGLPVSLRPAGDEGGTYENPADAEHETDWQTWQGPAHAWHDSTRTRVSLVSEATLGAWDVRRFRPNAVLADCAPRAEDELVGQTLAVGTSTLTVGKQIDRCVMVTRPQPARPELGLPAFGRDMDVLRAIHREHGGHLAIGALVDRPGTIAVGDPIIATVGS